MKNLKIEELSTQQKLGMLLCARAWGNLSQEEVDFILEKIRNHALGSVQVSWKQPELMEKIRAAADYPIIIITDMEMGCPGSELPPVPMMSLSACGKSEYYRAFARAVVSEGKKRGFNGAWSPNIDILDGDGPCRVFRRLSDDPDRVARTAEEMSRVFAENGFLSCGKHYPGGSREPFGADNHMTPTWSSNTAKELLDFWLTPYFHLMGKGLLPSIMVGHYTFSSIDPKYPASLSKKVIDLIRDRGYDGLVWSDDFGMMSILQMFGEENVLGMAIAAGIDIVLPNYNTPTQKHFERLERNYADGAFTEERLNDAVRHVLAAQAIVGEGVNCPDPFTAEDLELYNNIAKDCITAVTDPGVEAALPADNKDRLFVIVDKFGNEASQETIARDFYYPKEIEKKIHEEFPEAEVVYLPEYPNAKENEKVLLAATRHKEVVFITYCMTRPFLGTDCMTRRVESVINALILSGKVSAVVHFGNPFALKPLKHVERKLFGYMMPQSQLYAIEVLAGKLPARGTLPFSVEFE